MAGRYNLIEEYAEGDSGEVDDVGLAPYWVLCAVRLKTPLSYSRDQKKSVLNASEAGQIRGMTIITSDCVKLNIQGSKGQHTKQLTATLLQTHTNYLIDLLPSDWLLAWIVHGKDKLDKLVERIKKLEPCNKWDDGLKFVGRVESVYKDQDRDPETGKKRAAYSLTAFGFRELDTSIFYDPFLRSVDTAQVGTWMARIGLDIREIFANTATDGQSDNVHLLISKFLEVFVGRGLPKEINTSQAPQLRQATSGGIVDGGKSEEAPFAYLVPKEVGDLLGKKSRSKKGGILAYADLMELLFGVQKYNEHEDATDWKAFIPDIAGDDALTTGSQRYTGTPLMGAFLPLMPNFDNRPMWSVLQQYLNPPINEMYTCLRVNEQGSVVPTIVLRQIPFTTPVLAAKIERGAVEGGAMTYTGFMDVPRWVLPAVLIERMRVGRSDATRCNFVHVYGQNADVASNVGMSQQLAQNQPIRDDFDIQRSGLHALMTTVACREINKVGNVPSKWMELIADRAIGSQYTLNGTVQTLGIEAPICEGDNLEFGNAVFHIESVGHSCSIDTGSGSRSWMTFMTLTNGLRVATVQTHDGADGPESFSSTTDQAENDKFPLYPGLTDEDQRELDPRTGVDDNHENEKVDTDSNKLLPFDPGDSAATDSERAETSGPPGVSPPRI